MTETTPFAAPPDWLVAEQRRGRPGATREAALAAAAADPDGAAGHRLRAACASLVAGEPRRALALLDVISETGTDRLERQARACRVWAAQLDRNWYPGDAGAELAADAATIPTLASTEPGDPETVLLEAVVSQGPLPLLTTRTLIEGFARQGNAAGLQQILTHGLQQLQAFTAVAQASGVPPMALWAMLAQADLAWRAGFHEPAASQLQVARQGFAEIGDPAGVAHSHIVEGDWWAAPGSSPESLGFDLAVQPSPPAAGPPDAERAAQAYGLAASSLQGVDEPRSNGALALRYVSLAFRSGRFDECAGALSSARDAFTDAGDAAAEMLATCHGLLLDVALGEVARTRREAGSGWDLKARGPVAEILEWATRDGSASYCTGLGRLFQRAGEWWETRGDLERAATAFSMAVPLIGVSGAVTVAAPLGALARVDGGRGFAARALVRLEQAIERLPPPPSASDDTVRWMEHTDLVMAITAAQTNRVTSSPTALGIGGLERSLEFLQTIASVAGAPIGARNLLREGADFLRQLADAASQRDPATLLEQPAGAMEAPFIDATTQIVNEQIHLTSALIALSRGRLAQRGGWSVEAARWFETALAAADRGGPQTSWLGVQIIAIQGREAEAQARFAQVRDARTLPDEPLASLALRVRLFDQANEIYERVDATGPSIDELVWQDVLDRAELALELGDPVRALELASRAIGLFEDGINRLTRDPDRVAATNHITVPSLYLTACRACLAISPTDLPAADHLDRCFGLMDRVRSLSLMSLLGDGTVVDDSDIWRRFQETATEWSSVFERFLATLEGGDADRRTYATELTAADDELRSIEAEIETRDPAAFDAARRRPPIRLVDVQAALPDATCLIEYQLVGREMLIIGASSADVTSYATRLPAPVVEPLVNQLWRSCSAGAHGPEAAELARLLLDPVGELLGDYRRVIVVPYGPLNAVPFHVLPFDGALLGEHHVLSYLPAAALLSRYPVDGPVRGDGIAVVGDPAFDLSVHPSLRRLPGAAVEAKAVASLHGTRDLLIDVDAREVAVRPLLPNRAVVHLAAHGRLDEIAPSTSSIVLAGPDELTVAEFIGMRIQAGLVVLSACDSGRGAATLGGDLVGLTRSLIAAGVDRAVVSLWPVDDVSACVTMAAFHARLVADDPPALALANAQRLIRTLSGDEIAARYGALGGQPLDADRSQRRGGGGANPAAAGTRILELDPELLDDDVASPTDLGGAAARTWAPFILVGC